jgi:solute carrier family 20 (sodium-dependent phosphate transporter)
VLIVWKGAASASANVGKWSAGEYVGVILGTAAGVGLLSVIFLLPYLYCKLLKDDWQIRWYHIFKGPFLLRRGDVPPKPEGVEVVQNYYRGHKTRDELEVDGAEIVNPPNDVETVATSQDTIDAINSDGSSRVTSVQVDEKAEVITVDKESNGNWYEPKNIINTLRNAFFHGVEVDVIAEQKKSSILTGNLEDMHSRAAHFDNKAEHTYSFLQVLTAATASFAHGSNDVSKYAPLLRVTVLSGLTDISAVGPLAAVYLIWSTSKLSSKSPVPIWTLCYACAALIIGLWTYGYNIMRNLGNRLTLHSPSRGFSMELGSAVTVIMATRLALPVSTTQCIVGSTVGVGLCTGDIKAINWRMVLWIYCGWIITLPVTGIISGCLMGVIINAPQWGHAA